MGPTTTFNTCVVVNLDSINFKNSVEDNMRNLTLIIGLMGGCAYANAAQIYGHHHLIMALMNIY